jgi:GR25 family glycosyltransferase involved in LPS biosynthesis
MAGELKLAPEEESDKLSDVLGSNGSSQGVSSESSEKLTTPTNKQTWAWCINLDRRQDRMKGMQERSAKVGLKLVRHKAVDPSAGDVVDAASVCKEWDTTVNARFDFSYTPNRRLAMSNGELGCAMSHVQLWRKAKELDLCFAIILEDDIQFMDNFLMYMRHYMALLPPNWDLMYLDYNHGAYPVQYNQHFQKITYTWSTGAYIISKRGYRKLLKELPVDGPVDNFLAKRCLEGKLHAYVPDLRHMYGPLGKEVQLCAQMLGEDSDIEHSTTVPPDTSRQQVAGERLASAGMSPTAKVMESPPPSLPSYTHVAASAPRFTALPGLSHSQSLDFSLGHSSLGHSSLGHSSLGRSFLEASYSPAPSLTGYLDSSVKSPLLDTTPSYSGYSARSFADSWSAPHVRPSTFASSYPMAVLSR